MKNFLKKLKVTLFYVSEFIAALSLFAMLAIVNYQVFARFLPIRTPHWTEEVARFLMVYIVAFASGLAIEKKAFVGMDSLFIQFPLRLQKLLTLVFNVMTGTLFYIILYYGYLLMLDVQWQLTPALQIPMSYAYIALPLLGLNVLIFLLMDSWAAIRSLIKNEEVEVSTAEEHLIHFVSEEEKIIQQMQDDGPSQSA